MYVLSINDSIWFRRIAPPRGPSRSLTLAAYEAAFDYVVRLSCVCYAVGCRQLVASSLLELDTELVSPLVAFTAAAVLVTMGGFRNALKLPYVVYNDNSADRYRPLSTLTFTRGAHLRGQMLSSVPDSTAYLII